MDSRWIIDHSRLYPQKICIEYDPAAELSYIKCDIDYSALTQNETISNETVYSGPSTVEIKDIASNVSNSSQTTEPPAQEASSAPGFSGILAGLSLFLLPEDYQGNNFFLLIFFLLFAYS